MALVGYCSLDLRPTTRVSSLVLPFALATVGRSRLVDLGPLGPTIKGYRTLGPTVKSISELGIGLPVPGTR